MAHIRFAGRTINLPGNRLARTAIGVLLIAAGLLGFLPILGFWMIPLGLIVLSVDSHFIRRRRRQAAVKLGAWLKARWPRLAGLLGFTV